MEPYKIFDFPDETAWLKGRVNGIGGSDASAIVGMNPYKSNIDLFEEKIGRRIPEDIADKPCVIYGKLAEAPIRELFKLDYPEYQVEHHEFRILQSIRYPFMQASLDGELTDPDGRRRLDNMGVVERVGDVVFLACFSSRNALTPEFLGAVKDEATHLRQRVRERLKRQEKLSLTYVAAFKALGWKLD